MRSFSTHECLVYPGEYVPRQGMERRMAILRSSRKKIKPELQVNMKEFPDSYKFEIALPGVERDEIQLTVHNNILTIDVLHQDSDSGNERSAVSELHEFDMNGKEREVRLPDNADMEFVSAEFKKGLLILYIPKALVKVTVVSREIIVY